MNVKLEHLLNYWFEDKDGNILAMDERRESLLEPNKAETYHSYWPLELSHSFAFTPSKEKFENCKHEKYARTQTSDGKVRLVCDDCMAECTGVVTPTGDLYDSAEWTFRQYVRGLTSFTSIPDTEATKNIVLGLMNDGYTLGQALRIRADACERCMNVLLKKYDGTDGYEEYSKEWYACPTSCDYCSDNAGTLDEFLPGEVPEQCKTCAYKSEGSDGYCDIHLQNNGNNCDIYKKVV